MSRDIHKARAFQLDGITIIGVATIRPAGGQFRIHSGRLRGFILEGFLRYRSARPAPAVEHFRARFTA